VEYSESVKAKPSAVAYANRGLAYLKASKYELAIGDFGEAIRLDPTSAIAYSNRGLAYLKAGKYALAMGDLDKAIRLDPTDTSTLLNRSLAKQALDGRKE